jgi:FkbM family methyltransferase
VDWGCNAGYSSLFFKLNYPNCEIIGVEMDAENSQLAWQNCSNHGIQIVNCAITAQSGISTYSRGESQSTEAFSLHNELDEHQDKTYVTGLSPLDFFSKYNLRHIDDLKTDIEGEEWNIFQTSDLSWLENVRQLHVELHGNRDASPIVNTLTRNGFKTAFRSGKTPAIFAFQAPSS